MAAERHEREREMAEKAAEDERIKKGLRAGTRGG